MDQQQYIPMSSTVEGSTIAPQLDIGATELPAEVTQMDFQTIKSASDTLKVIFSSVGIRKLLNCSNFCFF